MLQDRGDWIKCQKFFKFLFYLGGKWENLLFFWLFCSWFLDAQDFDSPRRPFSLNLHLRQLDHTVRRSFLAILYLFLGKLGLIHPMVQLIPILNSNVGKHWKISKTYCRRRGVASKMCWKLQFIWRIWMSLRKSIKSIRNISRKTFPRAKPSKFRVCPKMQRSRFRS